MNIKIHKNQFKNQLKEMWDQEKHHLREFERLMPKYRARPTFLLPLWKVAGYALGILITFFILLLKLI